MIVGALRDRWAPTSAHYLGRPENEAELTGADYFLRVGYVMLTVTWRAATDSVSMHDVQRIKMPLIVWLTWRIGLWVSSLRTKYRKGKLTDERVAAAESIGVRFVPPYRDPQPKPPTRVERREGEFLRRLEWLEDYFQQNGHINVTQLRGTSTWPGAGRWIARLRLEYKKKGLPSSVVAEAERRNIAWTPGPGRRHY